MALSFFHGGQLAKGVRAQEGEGSTHAQSLRRLYSETALQEKGKSDAGSLRSFTPSRQRMSARGDAVKASRLSDSPSASVQRPATSYQNRHGLYLNPPDVRPRTAGSNQPTDPTMPYRSQTTMVAEPLRRGPSRWNNIITSGSGALKSGTFALKNIKKPSFKSLRREAAQMGENAPEKSPDKRSWKKKEAARRAQLRVEALAPDDEPPQSVMWTASQAIPHLPLIRTASQRAPHSSHSAPEPLALPRPRFDTTLAAQNTPDPSLFLAEALAHVIVGEWLYKDPHKPGLFPKANILHRQAGPPPRGATGVPQKRWFRIDPYERQLTWSSKWDTVEPAQHKLGRKVPIKLVFEVPNRLATDGCIPMHIMPFHYSIVVVAPSKVIKITAPDEVRHGQWLTALQYLVDSNKMVSQESWPDVLAARLALLTQPVDVLFDETPYVHSRAGTPYVTEKPLPPNPPQKAPHVTSMIPPHVPRFANRPRDTSADPEAFSPISEYGSNPPSSPKSQQVEPYLPTDTKEKIPVRDEQLDTKDEPAVDQMEALLARLN